MIAFRKRRRLKGCKDDARDKRKHVVDIYFERSWRGFVDHDGKRYHAAVKQADGSFLHFGGGTLTPVKDRIRSALGVSRETSR